MAERERIARDLGPHSTLILRNHGLIACGPTVQDAWNLMYWLETACQASLHPSGLGREPGGDGSRAQTPAREDASCLVDRFAKTAPANPPDNSKARQHQCVGFRLGNRRRGGL